MNAYGRIVSSWYSTDLALQLYRHIPPASPLSHRGLCDFRAHRQVVLLFESQPAQAGKLNGCLVDMDRSGETKPADAFVTRLKARPAHLDFFPGFFLTQAPIGLLVGPIPVAQGLLWRALGTFVHPGIVGGFESGEFFMQVDRRRYFLSKLKRLFLAGQTQSCRQTLHSPRV